MNGTELNGTMTNLTDLVNELEDELEMLKCPDLFTDQINAVFFAAYGLHNL